MKHPPYVGVTGYTDAKQVERTLEVVPSDADRKLMVGVLVSGKTLEGGTNRFPQRYPKIETVKDIFVNDSRCLNLIHYNTKDKDTLVEQALKVAELAGDNCHGFQFNIKWPNVEALAEIKRQLPNHTIVVQIGSGALKPFTNPQDPLGPMTMKGMLDGYDGVGVIDYMLFDPSGGTGKPFSSETAVRMLKPYLGQNINYGLGVAGGLSAATIDLLLPVVAECPAVSWDAEGRLRDENDDMCINSTLLYVERSYVIESVLNAKLNFPGPHVDYAENKLFDLYHSLKFLMAGNGYPSSVARDMLAIVFGRRFVADNENLLTLGNSHPEQG